MKSVLRRLCLLAPVAVLCAPTRGPAFVEPCRVAEAQITQLMRAERGKEYDLLRTANGVRLQAAVILGLVRSLRAADPVQRPLWIDHAAYFTAYLEANDLEAEEAPTFIRIAYESGEDYLIDYRAAEVIEQIEEGGPPDLAMNVIAGWQAGPDAPHAYTYEDVEADPQVRVTHERVNSYRILTYGDIVVYDAIEGIHGRPTSGALGVVFRVIGDGRAAASRMVVSEDGVQVTRTTARRGPMKVTPTVTIFPDGRAERGVPRGRRDLEALEERLSAPLRIRYVALDMRQMPPVPADDCEVALALPRGQ